MSEDIPNKIQNNKNENNKESKSEDVFFIIAFYHWLRDQLNNKL
jgi:hypothetical protein